jgi:hypothetical protein
VHSVAVAKRIYVAVLTDEQDTQLAKALEAVRFAPALKCNKIAHGQFEAHAALKAMLPKDAVYRS